MVFKTKRVVIQLVTKEGLTDKRYSFSSVGNTERFLGRKSSYLNHCVDRGFVKDVKGHWFAIISINDKKIITDRKFSKFYQQKFGMAPLLGKEEKRAKRIIQSKVQKLLLQIDLKYGDLVKASGSSEFNQLQKLLK